MFKGLKKKYIWINTPPDICKSNIKKRGRRRDLLNLSDTLAKNESIYDCYIQSDIDFDVVEIFETNERW